MRSLYKRIVSKIKTWVTKRVLDQLDLGWAVVRDYLTWLHDQIELRRLLDYVRRSINPWLHEFARYRNLVAS